MQIQKAKQESLLDEEYAEHELGCNCLDVEYKGQIFTINATDSINDSGHYINYASKNSKNVPSGHKCGEEAEAKGGVHGTL